MARYRYHKGVFNIEEDSEEREDEMYQPNRGKSWKIFRLPRFSFGREPNLHISGEITSHFAQFLLIVIIGLVLDYVYYSNLSLGYLFIGGIRDWFNILQFTFNFGMIGTYNLFYLIINGIYYFYLYAYLFSLIGAILTNLHRLGTWVFLGFIGLLAWIFVTFLPNVVY